MAEHPSIVFIFRRSPYSSTMAQEGLDALLATAAFEQDPTVIFMHEGIWQLYPQGESQYHKNYGKMLQALPLYGVEKIYVHEPSLRARVHPGSLVIPHQLINDEQLAATIKAATTLLSF